MILETHQALTQPRKLQATRLLVRDVYGQPALVVLEGAAGQLSIHVAGDEDFARKLEVLGVVPVKVIQAQLPGTPYILLG